MKKIVKISKKKTKMGSVKITENGKILINVTSKEIESEVK